MTGSGKSTLLNALLNPENLSYDNDSSYYEVKNYLKGPDGRNMFEIGNEVMSATKCPGFYPTASDKDHFFVDAPGVADSNTSDELPNMAIIHDIMARAKELTIILAFTGGELDSSRGENFLRCTVISPGRPSSSRTSTI